MTADRRAARYRQVRIDGGFDRLKLVNTRGAEFNAFVGKLGDVLVRALDRPLGCAIN